MELYCDNQALPDIVNNPVQHSITKHVDVDRNFINERLVEKLIDIMFVKLEKQLTDVLTHDIDKKYFHDSLDKLDMGAIYANLRVSVSVSQGLLFLVRDIFCN